MPSQVLVSLVSNPSVPSQALVSLVTPVCPAQRAQPSTCASFPKPSVPSDFGIFQAQRVQRFGEFLKIWEFTTPACPAKAKTLGFGWARWGLAGHAGLRQTPNAKRRNAYIYYNPKMFG